MCTVTTQFEHDRLIVTMNRDEFRSRAPEEAPAVRGEKANLIYPVDTKAGGTWIGVNRHGVCCCLTNQYLFSETDSSDAEPSPAGRSRGLIIPEILEHGHWQAVVNATKCLDPVRLAPFNLMVFASGKPWIEFDWPGQGGLTAREAGMDRFMLTSSSWNTESVMAWRRQKYDEWLLAPRYLGTLPTFHLLQPRDMEEWAPLMSRKKTHTRSITQIEVDNKNNEIHVRYWPLPTPSTDSPKNVVSLDLNTETIWEI
jgi:hypothetical protein